MRWEAPSISRFAQTAGFAPPALHTATAIALAGSGGIDHYDVRAGVPGCGRWVGLWALNTDEWPEYRPDDLHDPQAAANVAYALTVRCAGFGWSAVWRAGHDRRWAAHAATASSLDPFLEADHVPIHLNLAERQLAAIGRHLGRRRG